MPCQARPGPRVFPDQGVVQGRRSSRTMAVRRGPLNQVEPKFYEQRPPTEERIGRRLHGCRDRPTFDSDSFLAAGKGNRCANERVSHPKAAAKRPAWSGVSSRSAPCSPSTVCRSPHRPTTTTSNASTGARPAGTCATSSSRPTSPGCTPRITASTVLGRCGCSSTAKASPTQQLRVGLEPGSDASKVGDSPPLPGAAIRDAQTRR